MAFLLFASGKILLLWHIFLTRLAAHIELLNKYFIFCVPGTYVRQFFFFRMLGPVLTASSNTTQKSNVQKQIP